VTIAVMRGNVVQPRDGTKQSRLIPADRAGFGPAPLRHRAGAEHVLFLAGVPRTAVDGLWTVLRAIGPPLVVEWESGGSPGHRAVRLASPTVLGV